MRETFAEYWEEKGCFGCNPEEVAELAWNAAMMSSDAVPTKRVVFYVVAENEDSAVGEVRSAMGPCYTDIENARWYASAHNLPHIFRVTLDVVMVPLEVDRCVEP